MRFVEQLASCLVFRGEVQCVFKVMKEVSHTLFSLGKTTRLKLIPRVGTRCVY